MDQKLYEDEISLKELILTLMREWKIILITTLVVFLGAGVYVFFLADDVYEASVKGTIMVTETSPTKYGEYTFPSTNKMDYLNVVKSEEVAEKVISNLKLGISSTALQNSVEIITEIEQSSFEVTLKTQNQEQSRQILAELSSVYKNALTMKYKKSAVDVFIREYYVKVKADAELIDTQEKTIAALKEQIATIDPVVTLKKMVTSDPVLAAQVANDRGVSLESLSEEVMLEEIQNPAYTQVETAIVTAESELIKFKTLANQNLKLYDELVLEEKAIDDYYANGNESALTNGSLDLISSKVHMENYISAPEDPIAPNKVLVIAIGVVLGLMLGIFVAFFKAYWART